VSELQPHPWNTAFTWTDHGGPFTTLTEAQAAAFDRDGFFVLPGAFTGAEIADVTAALDPLEAETEAFLRQCENERVMIAEAGALTVTLHPSLRAEAARRFCAHPTLAGVCADLVGPDVRLYWDQAVYKKPEKPRRVPWHQDNGYAYVEPQQYLTCFVALTDMTLENGCPWLLPGRHRAGTLRHTYVEPLGWECVEGRPDDAVPATATAGDVVVFSSLTPHLTGPNTTDAVRKAYIIQYAPDGAEVLQGDPEVGPPTGAIPAAAPDRQFPVVQDGEPVTPAVG
jgi:ectoine hydroxylase-related dioxygenase (phytanoyl-CoA dioxygenase family)